jgi:P-type Cu+ transporter
LRTNIGIIFSGRVPVGYFQNGLNLEKSGPLMIFVIFRAEGFPDFCHMKHKEVLDTCYHCGDECDQKIVFDHKNFCCEGCRVVYTMLNSHELGGFYELGPGAGVKADFKGKFDFLDLPELREKFVIFEEQGITKARFFLPQVHCSSCLWLLERLSRLHEGIVQSQVSFVEKEVEITFKDEALSLKELAELLASIGYAPHVTLNDQSKEKKRPANKRLILQIGVAGFCFGNIMLLSFPEYLGIDERDAGFQLVFNLLNFGLSIPVLLFSARDYILSAYHAARSGFINIDIPITLGIIAFYIQSVYEIFSGTGAGYFDSFAGLIFFLLIGKWFQQATYGAINFERDYKSYFPIAVSRISEGTEQIIPLSTVRVGDHLMIRNNELVPADAILVKGHGRIDYSFVTGESDPVSKDPGGRLFAGGRQQGTSIEVEIEREIENSYLTRLWNNPVFNKEKTDTSFTENVTKWFTVIILTLAVVASLIWMTIDPSRSLFVVVSVLIIACPCAIALSVPFTYGNGIRILGKKSFYLRSSRVIESVADITDIVFDKTGTITFNNRSTVNWNGPAMDALQKDIIAEMTLHSSHPLSRNIFQFLGKPMQPVALDSAEELPGKGLSAVVDGRRYRLGSAAWVGVKNTSPGTHVYFAEDEKVIGSFSFTNVYRPGIRRLFKSLGQQYRLHILSGDNEGERETLGLLVPGGTPLHFNQQPQDKLDYVAQLQRQGKKVMMLGDGLNDAGALRQANVGVSVVEDVYSFSPSSDGIMDGERMDQLPQFIEFCRFNKRVVKLSYVFSICYNLVGLSFALTGTLTPLVAAVLMPLSSVSVVLLVTIMTNLRARKMQ